MNKLRVYVAASLGYAAAVIMSSSLIFALPAKKITEADCLDQKDSCDRGCRRAVLTKSERSQCFGVCSHDYELCHKEVKLETKPTSVSGDKAPTGQKVESTPKQTPQDKAPTGQGLQQSNPTGTPRQKVRSAHVLEKSNLSPTPTPSPKNKGNKSKQEM